MNSGNKYEITDNADGTVNIDYAGKIIQQGTPMSAEKFNHMEQGILENSRLLDNKADKSHTHNYAGSSSAGGSATAAVKLETARKINDISFDGSKDIYLPSGRRWFVGTNSNGEGWFHFLSKTMDENEDFNIILSVIDTYGTPCAGIFCIHA